MGEPTEAPGDLRVVVSHGSGDCVVEVIGELDVHTSPRLRGELAGLIDSGATPIVLDLSRLDFVDSTGLGVFVRAAKRLAARQRSLVLRAPRPATRKVLEITGLDKVLAIVE